MSKRCSCRGRIDTQKTIIRYATRPFDGSGYIFNSAIAELRKEGLTIVYDKKLCSYIKVEK